MSTKTFARVAMIAAIYTVLTLCLAPISFGNFQIRISEALTMGISTSRGMLFGFKDLDMLKAMPFTEREIVFSKIAVFTLTEYAYAGSFFLPVILIFGIKAGMAKYYRWDNDKSIRFYLAGALHDIIAAYEKGNVHYI